MRILGIDTSSNLLSLALSDDERGVTEETYALDRKHSSLLVPKIKELLEKTGLSIDGVGAFIVGLGPGSFTGLRIGVSAVKGLGIATGRPCVGVPSIDAMALNADIEDGVIVPVIDAKRQKLYSGIYKKEKGFVVRKSGHLLIGVHDLMRKIKGKAVFLGDGIRLYREDIHRLNKKAVFLKEDRWYPKAMNLIKLGLARVRKYRKGDLSGLNPIYLYPKDCQVRI